ncbi:MAG: AAA family ATPase [Ignavibacteria bacterium]|nr:AAA family ATPase [Ignavibacteria bacterium]
MNIQLFAEIAVGSVSNRNIVVPYDDIPQYIKPNTEVYRSFYLFDERIKDHFNSGRKTPEGYIYEYYIPHLIIDLDRKNLTYELFLEQLKDLLNYLIKDFNLEDNYRVFYSGTGFHIHFPDIFGLTPSKDLPEIVRESMEYYFNRYNIDTKIYHKRALIRVPFSYNKKTGLYKVYLTEEDLYTKSIEEIQAKAKEFGILPVKRLEPVSTTVIAIKPQEKPITLSTQMSIEPSNIVTCMQKLYNRGEVIGTRHESVLRLASWLMRNGVPIEGAIAMLEKYTPSLDKYELRRTVLNVYEKKYMYGCDDKVMKQYCDSRCIFYIKKNYLTEVATPNEVENFYKRFISGNYLDAAINLKDIIPDIPNDFQLIPGNMIGLIGDTGINKSALMQGLSIHFQKHGSVLYINTEMSDIEMYERFIMIAFDMTREQVRGYYQINSNSLSNTIKNILYTRTTPSFNDLKDIIIRLRPKVVIIDVIDDIFTQKLTLKDEEYMYMELKNLAKQYNFILFLVHHISKSGATVPTFLNKHSGKGSSAFEQKCDVVLGLIGNSTDAERTLKVLKGRSHPPFEIKLTVQPNYKFKEIDIWQP